MCGDGVFQGQAVDDRAKARSPFARGYLYSPIPSNKQGNLLNSINGD